MVDRDALLRKLVDIQYERNDFELHARQVPRARRDVEVLPAYEETAFRVEFFGDEVERLHEIDPLTGEVIRTSSSTCDLPGHALRHARGARSRARCATSARELEGAARGLEAQGKLLEAQRLGSARSTTSK